MAERLLNHFQHSSAYAFGFSVNAVRDRLLQRHKLKQDFVCLDLRKMHLGLARINTSQ